jgi:DNA-directed RNA polymerase specialized sigma24 family protein
LQYERRLAVIAGGLANVPPGSASAEQLCEEQAGLERKRTWRQQQRAHALEASQRASVTLRYREIAHLLNVPVGSVSAQVTRLRQELLKLAAQRASERRSLSSPPGERSG